MLTLQTLKQSPGAVQARPKAAADQLRRSFNSQAVVCLEGVRMPEIAAPVAPVPSTEEWLARLRKFRGRIPAGYTFDRQEANSRERE